ncbi:unnamed protein product, partial [Closterium sp. NIES-64]
YVALIGQPNAGKSTLLNRLIGQKLSIVTQKPQTTRHRILGLVSAPAYQIILYDTPGIIRYDTPGIILYDTPGVLSKSMHKLDDLMMQAVRTATVNADAVVLVIDITQAPQEWCQKKPTLIVLNKKDSLKPGEVAKKLKVWKTPTTTDRPLRGPAEGVKTPTTTDRPLRGDGGRRDAADEEEFPTPRGGGKRDIANDEQAFPVAREGGGQRYKRRDERERAQHGKVRGEDEEHGNEEYSPAGRQGEGKRASAGVYRSPEPRPGYDRRRRMAMGEGRWAEREQREERLDYESDVSRARLSGSGCATEKDEKGEGDHRTAPEQKEEVGSGGSKSGIARNVHLCGEMDVGRIRKGAGDRAKTTRGKVGVQVALGGYGSMEKDLVGPGQLVRDWSEHCTGQAQEAEETKESSEGLLCQIGEARGVGIGGDGAQRQHHG